MLVNLSVPLNGGRILGLPLVAGEVVFLLGANGTGIDLAIAIRIAPDAPEPPFL
jgi:hypothetical protein